MPKFARSILGLILVSVFILVFASSVATADLITVSLDIEKLLSMKAEKIIYTPNGTRFAILLQDKVPTKKREQVIYFYDFKDNKWTKGPELSQGITGELEPLAFSNEGDKFVFRLREDLIIMDLVKNEITHHLKEVGTLSQAVFSPDDRYLAFLMNAEWEVPTSLFLFDLKAEEEGKQFIPCVIYKNEYKAAGPLSWANDGKGIYFIEEFTWGTINSRGILKKFDLEMKKVSEVYNIKAPTARVSNYFYSPNGRFRALIIRDLDEKLQNSRYGLLIQENGEFVYGVQFQNWRDGIELEVTDYLSTAGWLGDGYFYWINRNEEGSTLNLYSIKDDKTSRKNYPEQVHITPAGILIKMIK